MGNILPTVNNDTFNYYDLDSYNKSELLDYIKQMETYALLIDDTYQTKLKDVNIESLNMISICIEMYEKMKNKLDKYVVPKDVELGLKKKYYVIPRFKIDKVCEQYITSANIEFKSEHEIFNFWSVQHSSDDSIDFDDGKITIDEYTGTFKDLTCSRDMIGISKKMLALLPNSLKQKFVSLFNQHLFENRDVSELSIGKSTYIHKRGKTDDINNFRQIITIPNIVKHLHRIMACRLDAYMSANNYIDKSIQKGGVSGQKYSILEQVCKIKQVIKSANKHGDKACIIFMDISNAFGSIDLKMMYKVLGQYGVPNFFINYVKNYYENFTYYAKIGKETTGQLTWLNGLVQGCPLSPILFVTCLNYILKYLNQKYLEDAGYVISLNEKILFTAYIDDIAMICRDENMATQIFNELVGILKSFGMKVNVKKCAFMNINCDKPDIDVKQVKIYKYLGEYLSNDGSCLTNYKKLIGTLGRKLLTLNKKKELSNDEKVAIYHKCIQGWLVRKLLIMYDLENDKRMKISGLVKKYIMEWGGDCSKIVLFSNVDLALNQSNDPVIQNMDIDQEQIIEFENKNLDEIEFKYEQVKEKEKLDGSNKPKTNDITVINASDEPIIDIDS